RDQQRVAASLHHLTAVFADCWVNESAPERAKAAQCADIVETDEPAVTGHIRTNDSNEPATTCGLAGEVRVEPTDAHWQTLTQADVKRQPRGKVGADDRHDLPGSIKLLVHPRSATQSNAMPNDPAPPRTANPHDAG